MKRRMRGWERERTVHCCEDVVACGEEGAFVVFRHDYLVAAAVGVASGVEELGNVADILFTALQGMRLSGVVDANEQ